MIVPSIDLQGGQAVQLIGGAEKAIDAGDPFAIAKRFAIAGEIAVIDLDAAMGKGDNRPLVERLVRDFACRVGGGIRDVDAAVRWLDAGARKVILGTRAVPEILRQLPRERVIAALDARDGEVVVEGWTKGTGQAVLERIAALKPFVGGFLITLVEREGRMGGTDLELARSLAQAAHPAKVTIAGGVTQPSEIAQLDESGVDAQVGMALYTGTLDLGDALAAPLTSDRPDGLFPTIVADERGVALGLVYSSRESIREAVRRGVGVYQSRRRGLWVKGETSGAVQELLRIELDCDRDTPRFIVRQAAPGFCHEGTRSCWGEDRGLGRLESVLRARRDQPLPGSYSARLFGDPQLLAAKLREETDELIAAEDHDDIVWEAADLLFFAMARLAAAGVSLAEVEAHLDARGRKITRRD